MISAKANRNPSLSPVQLLPNVLGLSEGTRGISASPHLGCARVKKNMKCWQLHHFNRENTLVTANQLVCV